MSYYGGPASWCCLNLLRISLRVHLQYVNDSVSHHHSHALCRVDHTLHAGLDDLLRVAQAFYVDDPDKLVRAAAQGNLDIVREVVRKHPSKVRGLELIYT